MVTVAWEYFGPFFLMVVVWTFILRWKETGWTREGRTKAWQGVRDLIGMNWPAVCLALVTIYISFVACESYSQYAEQVALARNGIVAQQALSKKRHHLFLNEPAINNAWMVEQAFWKWRQATKSPVIVFTTDGAENAEKMAAEFTAIVETATGVKVNDQSKSGANAGDIKKFLDDNGGTRELLLFARPGVPGMTELERAMNAELHHAEWRTTLPPNTTVSPNLLWLHFTGNVDWLSEDPR